MAAKLNCVDTVKARSRQPSKRKLESLACTEDGAVVVHRSSKKSSVYRLYDIDIIDEKDYKVKIHYVKYSAKHDEWISKSEVAYKPGRFEFCLKHENGLLHLLLRRKRSGAIMISHHNHGNAAGMDKQTISKS